MGLENKEWPNGPVRVCSNCGNSAPIDSLVDWDIVYDRKRGHEADLPDKSRPHIQCLECGYIDRHNA